MNATWTQMPAPATRAGRPRPPALRRPADRPPALTFSAAAWLKLQFLCHAGETEVGAFGIGSESDPLYLEDVLTVVQHTTAASVKFDDAAVADHFDRMVDRGLPPARFARLWVHTHPGSSPMPSGTDERTFARVFGACDWSVMFILARSGDTYARLHFSAGPGADLLLPVAVDWAGWAELVGEGGQAVAELVEGWMDEYGANVRPEAEPALFSGGRPRVSRLWRLSRLTVPADRERIPAWDGEWWELDPGLAAAAQMAADADDEEPGGGRLIP